MLALVTPMGPGGLRVAAIHRVLPDLRLDGALAAAAEGFRVRDLPVPGHDPTRRRAAIQRWLDDARAKPGSCSPTAVGSCS